MLSNFASKRSDKEGIPTTGAQPPATAPPPIYKAASRRPAAGPPASRLGERAQPSVIGPDLTIMGDLTSKGEVHVDGEVQGDVYATHVVVGEGARITGGIMAQEIVVRGHIMGFLRGHKVLLQATSHVEGDVLHRSLAIEQGAFFEGKSRHAEDPLAEGGETPREQPPAAVQPSPAEPEPAAATNGAGEG